MNILLISNNEICYNPRLLKAADYLFSQGCDVTVYNPITGVASKEVYERTISSRNWTIIEKDISKRTLQSYATWLMISLIHAFIKTFWDLFRSKLFFEYYLNKGLINSSFKLSRKYDYIIVNLVDSLPFASILKYNTGAKLIFDSQEYFTSQLEKYGKNIRDWAIRAQSDYFDDVDILIGTTNLMAEKIKNEYNLKIDVYRIRNLPSKEMLKHVKLKAETKKGEPIKLIWHGMSIYLNNTRGVHILLKAVSQCKAPVELYLMGVITAEQNAVLENYIDKLNLKGKVFVLPPADPDNIVASLTNYDIGLLGELPEDENQLLTSSNKFFDFINAGLAVILPNLPGLVETAKEYNLGIIYETGNYSMLAQEIEALAADPLKLESYKNKSRSAAALDLFWESDYLPLWETMKKYYEIKKILIISSLPLARNPRVLKELNLLRQYYYVDCVAFNLGGWSSQIDSEFTEKADRRNGKLFFLDGTRKNFILWISSTLIERVCRLIYPLFLNNLLINSYASNKRSFIIYTLLKNSVKRYDLIMAHTLPCLFPAAFFAKKTNTNFSFDLEDFHPEERTDFNKKKEKKRRYFIMKTLLPRANFVSVASPIFENKLTEFFKLPSSKIFYIPNSFPAEYFHFSSPPGPESRPIKLIWFSQYINFFRGLEIIAPVMDEYEGKFEMVLVGEIDKKFKEKYLTSKYITIIPPLSEKELLNLVCKMDVGLALELSKTDYNREISISNKLISYYQAGLFILATDTEAQTDFINTHPYSGIISKQDSSSIRKSLNYIYENIGQIRLDKKSRFDSGKNLNWENQSIRLVERLKSEVKQNTL